ncbi:hypothetical protein M747DRAFT_333309 [Aspergillus niger ATCC 13496]|uniref:Uncharacterized protein n=1 Tax=Aspergillus niger ATCC 13496 TaxID=1353008 RepID=A0A370BWU9_ASPNG|nr:hypothetical protein M747DRAFT_333309 [Aspergillus niger ATCC 13496]
MKTQNSAPLYACFSHLVLPMSFGIYYDPKKVNYGSQRRTLGDGNYSYRFIDRHMRQKLLNLVEKTSDLAGFGNIQLPKKSSQILLTLMLESRITSPQFDIVTLHD